MAEASSTAPAPKAKKDRSPSFPFVPLGVAVQRLQSLETHFGRHATPAKKVGLAWGMKEQSSQADQTLAALRSFGLVAYEGTGDARTVSVSPEGRTYLRAQQESVKEVCLKQAALRPKAIRKFWARWGADRPVDAVALDTLVLQNDFSETGARAFLKVYDDTVTFAKLSTGDKVEGEAAEDGDEIGGEPAEKLQPGLVPPVVPSNPTRTPSVKQVPLMQGERVVFTEEGSPSQYLKLVASGEVDDGMLEALEDFVKRQRKRLQVAPKQAASEGGDPYANNPDHGRFS